MVFRGYPVATIAFYGPTDESASKVAVGIVPAEGAEADPLERWFADDSDLRRDSTIGEEILVFIRQQGAKTVVMSDRIIGCPHEEGTDYPDGKACPECPFWLTATDGLAKSSISGNRRTPPNTYQSPVVNRYTYLWHEADAE